MKHCDRRRKIKIFCTIGPSSLNKDVIERLDAIGIDLYRINLSHTNIEDLANTIKTLQRYTKTPICLDTEGAQIRIRRVRNNCLDLSTGAEIDIVGRDIIGNSRRIAFSPPIAVERIIPGDLISIDFDSVLLQAIANNGNVVRCRVISGGRVSSNRAVTVDRRIGLPVMTEKDIAAVKVGVKAGLRHYALSFASSGDSVRRFRREVGSGAFVIAKIESKNGLLRLDEILKETDAILIDRGDLSREEPIEKIPFLQKHIIKKANTENVPVYVATNLLESMVTNKNPTRAELNDIVNTLVDGADGLVLAAETAIGKYPVNCASMVARTIDQFEQFSLSTPIGELERSGSSALIKPHGGALVDRFIPADKSPRIDRNAVLEVDEQAMLDAEQIAIGTFSPVDGFMNKNETLSVLKYMRLTSGVVWPMPITLQVAKDEAKRLSRFDTVALKLKTDGQVYAFLHLEQIYSLDLENMALEMFGTRSAEHPGVRRLLSRGGHFLSGKVSLARRLPSAHKHYELTPRQSRAIFENNKWSRVVGFHTRNVVHRGHEHIQKSALRSFHCDGLFIHPVVGPKKTGDYNAGIILKTYEIAIKNHYEADKVVLGAFQSYSRYGGPREAIFTALCRKNFGCSHFIVGRDHTGVADFYKPYDVHRAFDKIGDIGIVPIFFKNIRYCVKCARYVDHCGHGAGAMRDISGNYARELLRANKRPPGWLLRPEVSDIVLSAIRTGEEVFVE